MKELYWSKVILFGEYSMIFDSTALVLPLKLFSAKWNADRGRSREFMSFSRKELSRFCGFLRGEERFSNVIDLDVLEEDLQKGWYLDSDVPVGYGLGSSGTVVAAVYDRYAKTPVRDLMRLKDLFSQMESFFHGSSSGIDPLQCYLGRPFRITAEGAELLADGFLKNRLQICLIDTEMKSDTKPLVEYFKRQREKEEYLRDFQRDYLPYVKGCMDAVIQGDTDCFFKRLQKLTSAQRVFFSPMIPDPVAELFEHTYDFRFGVKILGSGGGGYILGFTDDRQKASTVLRDKKVLWLDVD